MGREASCVTDELGTIDLLQPVPHVGMQLLVQGFYLEAEQEKEMNYYLFALCHSSLLNKELRSCV